MTAHSGEKIHSSGKYWTIGMILLAFIGGAGLGAFLFWEANQ